MTLTKRKQCALLCETKVKTSCAVTTDIFSHDAAGVICATKSAVESCLYVCFDVCVP